MAMPPMTPTDLLILRFLLASCGSLAAGLGVWALTALCRRYLPDFASQRSLWLLSQITVAATFLVILLPHSERLRLVPQIELDSTTQAAFAAPASPAAPAALAGAPEAPAAPEPIERSWVGLGAQAWLLIYLLGLGYASLKLLHGQRMLHALAAAGCRVAVPDQHAGFAGAAMGASIPAPEVIEVDAPISPMLFGLLRPRLLLPRHLRSFEPMQQQMIVEHELTHLRRHDLHWMSAGIFLQTLLWFNPFMRLLRDDLSWAQELGCDLDVLRGRPQAQRKAYAAALVAQLKLQRRPIGTSLAFGGITARTLAARILLIRDPVTAPRRLLTRWVALAGLGSIFLGSLVFQPALAWRMGSALETAQPAPEKALWPRVDAAPQSAIDCIAMADASTGKQLVRQGQCSQRVTPASTFNIVVSLMGYDSGILSDEHTPSLPFKPGYVDWNPAWRQTTDPTSWIKHSVAWYAQQVATRLGAARFERYVTGFNYGNHDVSGDPGKNNGLTQSWIGSSLQISPDEQLAFLRKLVNRELSLSATAYDMTSRIMKPEILANGWVVQGKTGTASPVLPDGRDDPARQYGWYVGWAKKGERTIVFARLVLDARQESAAGGVRAKQAILRELPAHLDAL